MAQGYLLDEESIKAIRSMRNRQGWEPINRVGRRARWPIGSGGGGRKWYQLAEGTVFYRGSHPDGVDATEVAIDGVNFGRATVKPVRTGVTLYVGPEFRGAYIQRGSTFGNDPGDPGGGDPGDDPPCPPNCIFTGNGQIVTSTSPEWWLLASPTESRTATAAGDAAIFAVGGYKAAGKEFAGSGGEFTWIGVMGEDIAASGSSGSVLIDGTVEVTAFKLCAEGLSDGSPVHVIFRELGGIGGFVIVGRACCPGYDL